MYFPSPPALLIPAFVACGCHPAKPGPDTGLTETDTDDSADTDDTAELGPSPWQPPTWLDATPFTVPADRGWEWELDSDFSLSGRSVPQIFVGPDGRYGLINSDNFTSLYFSRTVFWSDDGLEWGSADVLLAPEDFGGACGTQLKDAAVVRADPSTWLFIVEGMLDDSETRYFCAATTHDLVDWAFAPKPIFDGFAKTESASTPAALAFDPDALGAAGKDVEGAHLWYNAMIAPPKPGEEGDGLSGIRVALLDPLDLEVRPFISEAVLHADRCDPMPVYIEGGGVRLFHTGLGPSRERGIVGDSDPGLYAVDLDDGLLPVDPKGTLLASSPGCPDPQEDCSYYMDPAFVRLPDDTLLIYASYGTYHPDGTFSTEIRRFISVD